MSLSSLPSPSLYGATQPSHGFVSPPPSGRRTRRNTSSSVNTDGSLDAFGYCDTGACDSDEEGGEDGGKRWLWRSPSVSSSSSGNGPQQGYFPALPRHHSDDHETRHRGSWRSPRLDDVPLEEQYGSPSSPSPARTQLQRSARSAPSVSRSSFSQPRAPSTHPASRSPADAEQCGCQGLTPHEAVLRSRLEGVLRGAKREEERRRSREREYHTGSGSTNSMVSSRNMSGEGDWFFAAGEVRCDAPFHVLSRVLTAVRVQPISPQSHQSDLPALSYSTRTRASTSATAPPAPPAGRAYRSVSVAHQAPRGVACLDEPLTPPPTPPFNARIAAAQCRAMDGYVSFADIEGLGVPHDDMDGMDADEDGKRARAGWLKWPSLRRAGESRK